MELMRPDKLAGALKLCADIVRILDGNGKFLNTSPEAEPQLGKRGIYRKVGGPIPQEHLTPNSLLDITLKSKFAFSDLRKAADLLLEQGLLIPCD